ncbi:MAG TPA: hypothetical protein ENN05_07210 [Deltaproteobacteria bacterium]|nr:hypothetical protein [Deltaproteobacteria bacterium]
MRRLFLVIILAVLIPAMVHAEGYVVVNYGIAGEIDEPSLGIEMGGIFLSYLHPAGGALSLGIGVSVGDTDEDPPSAFLPPSAATVYDTFRDYNDGNEQEVNMVFGAELSPSFFAVAGLGYASQNTTTIGFSGTQYYEVDTGKDINATWMVGMRYIIEGLNMGLGYHSRRGILASLGIAF